MDFDDAKENIQPLAAGRNVSILQASLRVDSQQELLTQRRQYEDAIRNYVGEDPLEPWYEYILWIEQSFPSGGKESGLDEVLIKCLTEFEKAARYYQDRRMIKLYIKYIDSHDNPPECYQQLYNEGIGTMVSDLYICWAYYYDLGENYRKADEIFRKGIACRAQPIEELKEAHTNFGFVMSQRILHNDDASKESYQTMLHEKRYALTSLRGHKKVGSIRTGAAVKKHAPGKIETLGKRENTGNQRGNTNVQVFKDEENQNPNRETLAAEIAVDVPKSVVRTIIDTARNQENLKEPGPWNMPHGKKKGKLFPSTADPGFDILEDEPNVEIVKELPLITGKINYGKPIKLPKGFVTKNSPQEEWIVPVTLENELPPKTLPRYDKCLLYPKPNMEFSPEELRVYQVLKRRNIENTFTVKYDKIWKNDQFPGVRMYPNFAKKNSLQIMTELDSFYAPDDAKPTGKFQFAQQQIYSKEKSEEYQFEELMFQRYRTGQRGNETISLPVEMDETICSGGSDGANRRKSFFPTRKSIAPSRYSTSAVVGGVFGVNVNKLYDSGAHSSTKLKPPTIAEEAVDEEDTPTYQQPQIEEDKAVQAKFLPDVSNCSRRSVICKTPSKVETQGVHDDERSEFSNFYCGNYKTEEEEPMPKPLIAPPSSPVKIYQDTTEYDFPFKTPPVPPVLQQGAKHMKGNIEFQIYEEEHQDDAENQCYEANETCTQVFNCFLKAHSASTPKLEQKTQKRVFGTILSQDTAENVVIVQQKGDDLPANFVTTFSVIHSAVATPIPEENSEAYGMGTIFTCGKQLSTIMETTSEQVTGTTASTKSTISSPEFAEDNCSRMPQPAQQLAAMSQLETAKKGENSNPDDVQHLMKSMKINNDNTNVLKTADFVVKQPAIHQDEVKHSDQGLVTASAKKQHTPETPLVRKVQRNYVVDTPREDTAETMKKSFLNMLGEGAGNFSRLEEREDTAPVIMLPVKYQEDKTETVTKMILVRPSGADQITTQAVNKSTAKTATPDDYSFSIFTKTPPHKGAISKKNNKSQPLQGYDSKFIATPQAKFKCNYDTPELCLKFSDLDGNYGNNKEKIATISKTHLLCEDNLPQEEAAATDTTKAKQFFTDSFLPDFSVVQFSSPDQDSFLSKFTKKKITNKNTVEEKVAISKKTNDSFMPDFSMFNKSAVPSEHQKKRDDSFMPGFPMASKTAAPSEHQKKRDDSFMPDFSMASKSAAPSEHQKKRDDSFMPGFSVANKSAASSEHQKKRDDSFMPDFSMASKSAGPSEHQKKRDDSFMPGFSVANKFSASSEHQKKQDDSFMPDFSMSNKSVALSVHQKKQDDSFMPDFSMPNKSVASLENQKKRDDSFMLDFSIATKSAASSEHQKKRDDSFMPDISIPNKSAAILETQKKHNDLYVPDLSVGKNSASFSRDFKKSENSFRPDYSIVKLTPADTTQNNNLSIQKISLAKKTTDALGKCNQSVFPEYSITAQSSEARPQEKMQQDDDSFMLNFSTVPTQLKSPTLSFLSNFKDHQNKDKSTINSQNKQQLATKIAFNSIKVDDKEKSAISFTADASATKKPSNNSLSIFDQSKIQHKSAKKPTPYTEEPYPQTPFTETETNYWSSAAAYEQYGQKVFETSVKHEKFFENNIETDVFAKNISRIQSSTLLPNHGPKQLQIKEESIHIIDVEHHQKSQEMSNVQEEKIFIPDDGFEIPETQPLLSQTPKSVNPDEFIEIDESDEEEEEEVSSEQGGNIEMSIYHKYTTKTPKLVKHIWHDSDDHTPNNNNFVYRQSNELDHTLQVIDDHCSVEEVNPFSGELIAAFIDKIGFEQYMSDQPTCELIGKVAPLHKDATIKIKNRIFDVIKLIGEGSYGVVFCGKDIKTGKKYAFKQERPANLWEYYICLELHCRLCNDDMRQGFMEIEYALIGNNASILLSTFSSYGSLINVCNKIKKVSLKNIDEYVVMFLTSQLLQIIDHLHAANIIHADIKADNILLMEKLCYGRKKPALQLIDFGVSIDMDLFKKDQTFNYIPNDENCRCVEMRENRPWTYQFDLYGLSGVIHVLLFGKYMEIVKKPNGGNWTHKTHVPRYFKKDIWKAVFDTLLNIKDCQTMPNLQSLRAILEEELADKEKYVLQKISDFNRALDV